MPRGGSFDNTPNYPLAEHPIRQGDLVLAVGNGKFLSHEITGDEVVIGRDPECDFVIDHPSLSRRHAILRIAVPATVQDIGSTNGTQLGGRLLKGGEPRALQGRAGFEIGPFAFVLVTRRDGGPRSRSGRDALRIDDPTVGGATAAVREFAATDVNVLITGETGVGKEVLAATVHELSARTGPFVQVNCASLSESLVESELFGHERGAFTGALGQKCGLIEAAAGGSILLDEIGELPLATQAKLLRVIEQREVLRLGAIRPVAIDVRFIAATNRDLAAEVARGVFRADLFYRLDGITLVIPPLRERRGAIAPLALRFAEAARRRLSRTAQLSPQVIAALEARAWPGNVRELKAVIERAAVLAGSGDIAVKHLVFSQVAAGVPGVPDVSDVSDAQSQPSVPALEPDQAADRVRVIQALEQCAGNQTRAAQLLGISRTTMITKLRIYKIARPTRPGRGGT
jgi:two-component system, NtrC family, response regulator AtoC